jgi:hypothetical protein
MATKRGRRTTGGEYVIVFKPNASSLKSILKSDVARRGLRIIFAGDAPGGGWYIKGSKNGKNGDDDKGGRKKGSRARSRRKPSRK